MGSMQWCLNTVRTFVFCLLPWSPFHYVLTVHSFPAAWPAGLCMQSSETALVRAHQQSLFSNLGSYLSIPYLLATFDIKNSFVDIILLALVASFYLGSLTMFLLLHCLLVISFMCPDQCFLRVLSWVLFIPCILGPVSPWGALSAVLPVSLSACISVRLAHAFLLTLPLALHWASSTQVLLKSLLGVELIV